MHHWATENENIRLVQLLWNSSIPHIYSFMIHLVFPFSYANIHGVLSIVGLHEASSKIQQQTTLEDKKDAKRHWSYRVKNTVLHMISETGTSFSQCSIFSQGIII